MCVVPTICVKGSILSNFNKTAVEVDGFFSYTKKTLVTRTAHCVMMMMMTTTTTALVGRRPKTEQNARASETLVDGVYRGR